TATVTRTRTLGGNNTGDNAISGTIQNNNTGGNGLIALTKVDVGTWILSGDNTYTGITTVSGGKLLINGDQTNAVGNVSVAANAILGGTGVIGGNTTIAVDGCLEFNLSTAAGSHNPLDLVSGKSLAFSGASVLTITSSGGAAPGIYTLVTGGNNITGVAPATVNLPVNWTATVSISGNSLLLNVVSTSGSGPVDHFAISAIGSTQTVGTPITGITITAQDSSNATATGFTGTVTFGGTGSFSGTSASFTAGVLSNISVTPTVAGSNLTLTVNDGAGHTGSASIATILSVYNGWSGSQAVATDSNNDGVPNGLAWALGAASPSANATGILPAVNTASDPAYLTYTFRRSDAANAAASIACQ
ncbi:MAG TPA: autotransporter-associated beta strand repeat-containing protein, partial [Verrucomicrobiae bacterium]|nr:autotransporter-associated beta strand repeat-containing protein [Verrucomicrobiae bacterium]